MDDGSYTITIKLRNVTTGDVTLVAQDIWEAHAYELDASRGDFAVFISKGGFRVDWEPEA